MRLSVLRTRDERAGYEGSIDTLRIPDCGGVMLFSCGPFLRETTAELFALNESRHQQENDDLTMMLEPLTVAGYYSCFSGTD
jgi:hypothetical protein